MKPADHGVTITLSAYRWFLLLGYLSGVGIGDELEAYGWIEKQLSKQIQGDDSE